MSTTAPSALDAGRVRAWAAHAAAELNAVRADLDRINVFPVADADTGTNLGTTVSAATASMDASVAGGVPTTTAADALAAFADAALVAARGNSGTILGAYLRGLAEGASARLDGAGTLDGPGVAHALDAAALAACRAVAAPAPGTVLTAARAAADAALDVANRPRAVLDDVLLAAARGARAAAARSAAALPVVARCGVPDAGALGLVVLLDSLVAVVTGRLAEPLPGLSVVGARMPTMTHGPMDGEFEVVFSIDADDAAADALRHALRAVGSSIVVAGGGGADDRRVRGHRVHVHTGDPEAVLRIGHMAAEQPGGGMASATVHAVGLGNASVIAFTSAPALVADLARTGATVYLEGGPGAGADLTPPAFAPAASDVVVLPARALEDEDRDSLCRMLGAAGARVEVLSTASDVEVVALLAAMTGSAAGPAADDFPAMAARLQAAVAATRTVRGALAAGSGQGGLPEPVPGSYLTVLADDDADHARLAAWAESAADAGAEVVVLTSGRPGPGIQVAVEVTT